MIFLLEREERFYFLVEAYNYNKSQQTCIPALWKNLLPWISRSNHRNFDLTFSGWCRCRVHLCTVSNALLCTFFFAAGHSIIPLRTSAVWQWTRIVTGLRCCHDQNALLLFNRMEGLIRSRRAQQISQGQFNPSTSNLACFGLIYTHRTIIFLSWLFLGETSKETLYLA